MKKRDATTMLNLILKIANADENICAVIMNGSRASPGALKDDFQDFDIVYIVKKVEVLVEHREWLKAFGEILIMQTPDQMDGLWPKSKDKFAFLMQFKDGNRIDLTLIEYARYSQQSRDSQSILLLDKDLQLGEFPQPNDSDYLPNAPSEKEFINCCNEFFWVSIYVAKGIARKQLIYTKTMAENIVKEQLIMLLTWHAAINTHFKKSMGAYGKYLNLYLEPKIWNQFSETYVDADYKNIWLGLFKMCELFDEIAKKVANYFAYPYEQDRYHAVIEYLKTIQNQT